MAAGFAQWGNDLYTGRRSYNIVGRKKWYFTVAIVMMVLSVVIMLTKGFNYGIEFKGGSEFVVSDTTNHSQQPAIDAIKSVDSTEQPQVTNLGSSSIRVQTEKLTNKQVENATDALAKAYGVGTSHVTSSYIGPTWGADVSKKALTGLIVFLALLAVVMTVYFRNWRMAAAALIALFHDLVFTVGVYALVGWEVTPATVIGFLTILGYSMYDTVVVFDKVRENTANIFDQTRATYDERANLAVNQTLVRSINTSVVALLPVASILVIGTIALGAGTLQDIALALFVGMAIGAYSSIYLATPLEVMFRDGEKRVQDHTALVLAKRSQAASEGAVSEDGEALIAPGNVQLAPGSHQGVKAQPRRRGRSAR